MFLHNDKKIFIFCDLLVYTELVLMCCDFNVFAGWIDKKYIYNLDIKKCFIPMELLTDKM
jgi:hypothetical protein